MTTPTPKTDKHADCCPTCGESVHASFARQLERELMMVRAHCDRAEISEVKLRAELEEEKACHEMTECAMRLWGEERDKLRAELEEAQLQLKMQKIENNHNWQGVEEANRLHAENERLREALAAMVMEAKARNCGLKIAVKALTKEEPLAGQSLGAAPCSAANLQPTISLRELNNAVMNECSCGGGGPDDKHTCAACQVYHRLVTLRALDSK